MVEKQEIMYSATMYGLVQIVDPKLNAGWRVVPGSFQVLVYDRIQNSSFGDGASKITNVQFVCVIEKDC